MSDLLFDAIFGSHLEMVEDWGTPATGVRFQGGIDPIGRCAVLATSGVWSVADVDRFYDAQKKINEAARHRFGRLALLMDLRHATVVTQDASTRMQSLNDRLYQSDDRVAIVISSALMTMQLRRAFTIGTREVFDSIAAAKAWLSKG
jgi:hypothetical protein